jgi:glycosyltransferase involved in cell wall biosynthesis
MTARAVDIICPVFREAQGIAQFHARLSAVLDGLPGHLWRVIYVVDPAGDDSEAALAGIAARDSRVEVLVMSRRFGHQNCLLAGMEQARSDAVIMLDSDQQHPPELIPELLREWEGGADIVQTLRADGEETGLLKRVTSRLFYRLFTRMGSLDLPAGAADYRLLSRKVVEVFRNRLPEQNPFLRGLVHWVGFNVRYLRFTPEVRRHGSSSYRPTLLLGFALNGWCSFSKTPLRICVLSGIALAVLAALVTLLQVLAYLLGGSEVPGWLSLVIPPAFFGGVQLIFLGVIGEYVGLIFDEVKRRPRYIIQHHHRAGQAPAQEPPPP